MRLNTSSPKNGKKRRRMRGLFVGNVLNAGVVFHVFAIFYSCELSSAIMRRMSSAIVSRLNGSIRRFFPVMI